ncbi:MAG: hypothetical protein ACE5GZ_13740 [Gammaproteobacteria bacterium]
MKHICEKLIRALKYLEEHGFSQAQLSSVHHFYLKGRAATYASTLNYLALQQNLWVNKKDF